MGVARERVTLVIFAPSSKSPITHQQLNTGSEVMPTSSGNAINAALPRA